MFAAARTTQISCMAPTTAADSAPGLRRRPLRIATSDDEGDAAADEPLHPDDAALLPSHWRRTASNRFERGRQVWILHTDGEWYRGDHGDEEDEVEDAEAAQSGYDDDDAVSSDPPDDDDDDDDDMDGDNYAEEEEEEEADEEEDEDMEEEAVMPKRPRKRHKPGRTKTSPSAKGRKSTFLNLSDMLQRGVITPGHGVLTVYWWGVRLFPTASLDGSGEIRLPIGWHEGVYIDPKHELYKNHTTPSGCLRYLAAINKLDGFVKGNGWQAVYYNGVKLFDIRGDPIGCTDAWRRDRRVGDDDEESEDDEDDGITTEEEATRGMASVAGSSQLAQDEEAGADAAGADDEAWRRLKAEAEAAAAHRRRAGAATTLPRASGRALIGARDLPALQAGYVFSSREALHDAGVHRGTKGMDGVRGGDLSGNEDHGCFSLVLSAYTIFGQPSPSHFPWPLDLHPLHTSLGH